MQSVLPMLRARLLLLLAGLAATTSVVACFTAPEEAEDSAGALTELPSSTTVSEAAAKTCTTEIVSPLSKQLVEELNCLSPGTLVRLPDNDNVQMTSAVFPYMQAGAAQAFDRAVDAYVASLPASKRATAKVKVNSAFRTLPAQYLVSVWGARKACGVPVAARPGTSKHESGLALDIDNWDVVKRSLSAQQFEWFGPSDEVHYTYAGSDVKALDRLSVRAFQRLWNRNNPNDILEETGLFDTTTEKRLKSSPIGGFTKRCSTDTRDAGARDAGDSGSTSPIDAGTDSGTTEPPEEDAGTPPVEPEDAGTTPPTEPEDAGKPSQSDAGNSGNSGNNPGSLGGGGSPDDDAVSEGNELDKKTSRGYSPRNAEVDLSASSAESSGCATAPGHTTTGDAGVALGLALAVSLVRRRRRSTT